MIAVIRTINVVVSTIAHRLLLSRPNALYHSGKRGGESDSILKIHYS